MHRCPSGVADPTDAIPRRRRERCPGCSGAGSHAAPRMSPASGSAPPPAGGARGGGAMSRPSSRAGAPAWSGRGLAPGDRGSAEGLFRSCAGARGEPPPRALDDRRRPADADVQAEAPKAGGALRKGDPGAVPGTLGRRVRRRVGREPGRRAERGARLMARFSADAALVPPPLRRAGPSVRQAGERARRMFRTPGTGDGSSARDAGADRVPLPRRSVWARR